MQNKGRYEDARTTKHVIAYTYCFCVACLRFSTLQQDIHIFLIWCHIDRDNFSSAHKDDSKLCSPFSRPICGSSLLKMAENHHFRHAPLLSSKGAMKTEQTAAQTSQLLHITFWSVLILSHLSLWDQRFSTVFWIGQVAQIISHGN